MAITIGMDYLKAGLAELCGLPGLSGFEDRVRACLNDMVKPYVDEVVLDGMGNLIATKTFGKGSQDHVLAVAHMDEIGFLVSLVRPDGFIRLVQVGKGLQEGKSFDPSLLLAQRVDIVTDRGLVPGVIGYPRIFHFSAEERSYEMHQLFLDIGAQNVEEANSIGIEIGQPVVFHTPWLDLLGQRVAAKALDSRAPSLVLAEAAKGLARNPPAIDLTVHFVWTVQKKIGEKGIKVVCQRLTPRAALIIDASPARSLQARDDSLPEMGAGPTIRLAEGYYGLRRGLIADKKAYDAIKKAAREGAIPNQTEILQGYIGEGKDIQTSQGGVPACTIGIPIRNMLGPVQVVDIGDVRHGAQLVEKGIGEIGAAFCAEQK